MGLCGCYPSCSCFMRVCDEDNGLLTITGDGDPLTGGWELCVVETPFEAVNDDGGIEFIPGGPYGHNPHVNLIVEDSPTIALSVTPGFGLQASLISVPAGSGGVPTGMPMMWLTNVAPAGYIMATGVNAAGYIPIASEPALFAVIGHQFSGFVDPADGTFLVQIPDDSFFKTQGALGNIGSFGGVSQTTLGVANLAIHSHGVTDPGHGHTASTGSAGTHDHEPGSAGRSFVTVDNPPQNILIANDAPDDISVTVSTADDAQKNNGSTNNAGSHAHTVTVDAALTGISTLSAGSATPFTNMPPYWVGNIILKT